MISWEWVAISNFNVAASLPQAEEATSKTSAPGHYPVTDSLSGSHEALKVIKPSQP